MAEDVADTPPADGSPPGAGSSSDSGANEAGRQRAGHRRAKAGLRRRRAARRVVVGTGGTAGAGAVAEAATTPDATGRDAPAATTEPRAAVTAPTETGPPEAGAPEAAGSAPASEPRATTTGRPAVVRRAGWLVRPERVLPAVALLLALVTTLVLGWKVMQSARVEEAESDALAVGARHIEGVLSFDYRNLDQASTRAKQALTPGYLKEYRRSTQDVVWPNAPELEVVVRAQVVEASVVQASADKVDLLLFVNRETTAAGLPAPKIDLERVKATMRPVDDEWRIDGIDLL